MSEGIMFHEFDGLDATEKAGIGTELNRCRALATKIANELRNKRPEHFVDKLSLADVHAAPALPRRCSRGPRLGLWCVGQALATEAIAECIRSGGVREAESKYRVALPRADSGHVALGCAVHGGRRQILGKRCESLPAEVRVRPDPGSPVRSISRLRRVISPNPPPLRVPRPARPGSSF